MKQINSSEFDSVINNGISFVDFYADWCGPCKMMSPVIEEVEKEISNISFYKVNVDEAEEIAARYGIMSIPTFIIFKDGNLLNKIVGGHSKQEMLSFIKNNGD